MSKWHKNWFSNMLPFEAPLVEDGIKYLSPENYYQAHKFLDLNLRRKIAELTPQKSKVEGRKHDMRDDWTDELKLSVMETALRWKFQKGTEWYDKLMETGSDDIIEWNNWNDTWWGVCIETKQGKNNLGKLLMKIRNEFRILNA